MGYHNAYYDAQYSFNKRGRAYVFLNLALYDQVGAMTCLNYLNLILCVPIFSVCSGFLRRKEQTD